MASLEYAPMDAAAQSPVHRIARRVPARELITDAQLAQVRERSPWRGLAMVAHAWATIGLSVALVAIWPNPLTLLAAIVLIGSRQLGLAILMHEGAHGCLHPDTGVNFKASQWFCAYPLLADTRAYWNYHRQHHAHTQTEHDPDFILSRPFPITSASYRRKFLRDISGQTGYEQRKAQLLNALGPADQSWPRRLQTLWSNLGPQLTVNAVIFLAMTTLVGWWAYPLLWIVPNLTWNMVVTRVRNIAEHAVIPDSTDPLRNTRTTLANRFERLLLAPYYVNYHLEHHLFFYVPAYNLPKVHAWLMAGPHGARMEVQHGYRGVLEKATARPLAEDSPGEIVNAARRARAGSEADPNRAKAGF